MAAISIIIAVFVGLLGVLVAKKYVYPTPSAGKSLLDVLDGTVKSKEEVDKGVYSPVEGRPPSPDSIRPVPELPEMTFHPTPRFDFSDPKERAAGLKYLDDHGYLVVKSVLNKQEVEKAKDLFWEWIETIPSRYPEHNIRQCKRDDPFTWTDGAWPADPNNGIISNKGIGQSAFLWLIRSRPKVIDVFQAVWGDDDLITSFDGAGAFRPWRAEKYRKLDWRTMGGWWHIDQNPVLRPGKVCVQGLVSLYPGTCLSGSLAVIPKSHLNHVNLTRRRVGGIGGDFVFMKPDEPILQTPPTLVQCEPGDLLLWDSRTVHCNCPGEEEIQGMEKELEKENENEPVRLVGYVCMTPAKMAGKKVIEKRVAAIAEFRTTTHWPHEFYPTSRGAPMTPSANPYIRLVPHLVHGKKWTGAPITYPPDTPELEPSSSSSSSSLD